MHCDLGDGPARRPQTAHGQPSRPQLDTPWAPAYPSRMSTKGRDVSRLRILLEALADQVGAECCAVFMPRQMGLGLVAYVEVDQVAIDVANGAWIRHSRKLEEGTAISYGQALVWPLFDNSRCVAVIYLDKAPASITKDEDARRCVSDIVARLHRVVPPTLFNNYLAIGLSLADARREAERDQLIMALRLTAGKIRATARLLGVTRETIYKRADRLKVDLDEFRHAGG